jgi:hypothetical protein
MSRKKQEKDMPHKYREDNQPHQQTGNINSRNNNLSSELPTANDPNVERANDAGIGDSGINDVKLTNHTQNHSSDA